MTEDMTIEERLRQLLGQDVGETVSGSCDQLMAATIALQATFTDDPKELQQRVVDELQQVLHDTFVDTTWPACPEHPNHPLWFSNGWWRCEQSGTGVAPLGGLGRRV